MTLDQLMIVERWIERSVRSEDLSDETTDAIMAAGRYMADCYATQHPEEFNRNWPKLHVSPWNQERLKEKAAIQWNQSVCSYCGAPVIFALLPQERSDRLIWKILQLEEGVLVQTTKNGFVYHRCEEGERHYRELREASPRVRIGKVIAKYRKKSRLTQMKLALQVGVTASRIGQIERGKIELSPEVAQRISDTLNLPLEKIYPEDEEVDPRSP
jgi:DNA-binding XRE family transcriptional regulator